MTEQELDRRARELDALMAEADADRVTEDEFRQAFERIHEGLSDRERVLVFIRTAQLFHRYRWPQRPALALILGSLNRRQ